MHFYNLLRNNLLLAIIVPVMLLSSCDRPPVKPQEEKPSAFANGVFVLNEGSFQHNNSTLSFYNFTDNSYSENIFLDVNHRGLGDVGNDLQKYGTKLYCVVNNSNIVEVMNAGDAKSIKTLTLTGKQPRFITFLNDKGYISCFDGEVVRIDTATLEVEATVRTGSNPDGICVCNGKIYVANSGGLNYPNYGNTVSVIDPNSFSVIKDVAVTINPTKVKAYGNRFVYVVSNGNYNDVPFTFQKIDCQTDELVKNYNMEVLNLDICQNRAYMYSYNYSTQESWVKVLNLDTDEIEDENFIKDGTRIKTPYGIRVNPMNGDVWITDAGNYTVNGDVYCFDRNGKKKFSFEAGICPGSMVFN